MGMDIYGSDPSSDEGESFDISSCGWHMILLLMRLANEQSNTDLVSEKLLASMKYNDGSGLNTQKECNLMADALEKLIENKQVLTDSCLIVEEDGPNTYIRSMVGNNTAIDRSGRILSQEEIKTMPKEEVFSAYCIGYDQVHEFIEFLRCCGGFEVC